MGEWKSVPVSYTHLDVYKRQREKQTIIVYNEKKLTDIFKEICRNKILAFRWRAAFEMNNKDRGILGFLETHSKSESVSFHMPGHKNGKIFKRIGYSQEEILNPQFDITEIEGADNLFEPEGIIRETMDKFKKIYELSLIHI